jgi:eukaryotic-like serine/threonine-protein kinase
LTDQHDDAWLIAIADDIGDGRPVDWNTLQQQCTNPATAGILRGLKRLAGVVEAHRTHLDEPSHDTPPVAPKLWRHLILLEVVGSGAFGTVYRAWDSQLEREVALKLHSVVPGRAPLTEAQHHARIRHPNVVAVYGAEQCDQQVGIWMEFIEGETLATFVQQRGPMNAREVAAIGIDVCRALTALHSAGLLHRDIKAQNVMREVGGRIVLMDFSGAGALQSEGSVAELSGTPLYMAPELFEGQPASPRTETYSLGILLFHLFSGRLPIEGPMLSDVRRAHRSGKRLRLRDLRPELPDTVVQIVERAAHVDPAMRYATAGDLEDALAGILGSSLAAANAVATPGRPGGRSRIVRVLAAFTAVTIVTLVTVPYLASYRRDAPPLDIEFTIGPPYNAGPWPRVSPDGRSVVFGAPLEGRPVLWTRPLGGIESRPIANAGTVETPFWSPDGRQLAYLADAKLKIVDIESGRSETLTAALHMAGGDWNREGVLIFATDTGIDRIRADGTDRRHVTVLDRTRAEYRHGWPEFLPDGRRFLFVNRSKVAEQTGVYLASIDDPALRRRILPAYSRVAYSDSGHLLYVRNGTLMAQPFDERSAELTGEPVAIGGPVKYHATDDGAFDVSANGVLIYRMTETPALTRLVVLDRRGRELHTLAPTESFAQPRLSPDGKRVAAEKVTRELLSPDIWVFDLERRNSVQLTRDLAPDVHPVWSPDGHSILFSARRGASFDLYRRSVEDPRDERLVWRSDDNKRLEDVSRDGRLFLVSTPRKGLWAVTADDTSRQSLIQTTTGGDNGMQAEFSPDAKFVAYASEESGRPEVYVRTLPATVARWQLSTSGGAEPHWRADGRELFFLSADGWLMSVPIASGPDWKTGRARRLFRVTVPTLFGASNFAASRDGERFVVNSFVAEAAVPAIHVVVNHPALMKQ